MIPTLSQFWDRWRKWPRCAAGLLDKRNKKTPPPVPCLMPAVLNCNGELRCFHHGAEHGGVWLEAQ